MGARLKWQVKRTVVFAGVGIALLLSQAAMQYAGREPNQWIIFAALICMGLPIPMIRDEEREAKRTGERPPPDDPP